MGQQCWGRTKAAAAAAHSVPKTSSPQIELFGLRGWQDTKEPSGRFVSRGELGEPGEWDLAQDFVL